jgi:putative tricarboxylic transport membrane protein
LDLWQNIGLGFAISFEPMNLFYCLLGVFIGTLIGVLPGIGPNAAMSMLLPVTFLVPPVSSLIMLAGIYYGAMYGGSTTSILVNIPGEASSVVTCLDGYQMARQGRAGPALGIAAFGSFIAGTVSIMGIMFLAPPLARIALEFGPPEYFSLMCLGLTVLIYLASGSIPKALMMASLGFVLSSVGIDSISGRSRFSFGIARLMEGIDLIPVIMGLFGISEVLINLEHNLGSRRVFETKIKNLLPTARDWASSWGAILRGSLLGFLLGILPGGGAIIASFTAYALEKKISKHPEQFGSGAIEGVASPESANNAATGGAFIPALALGIPSNVVMVVILGALMVHGIQPGPLLMKEKPELFWGVITSMYVGNGMLLVLNLPLIGVWVQILRIPYKVLFPLIILFCFIGVYSVNGSTFDMNMMILFGILGYLIRKLKYEGAPFILAFLLGPLMERSLRQALIMSDGGFGIFFTRPISLLCMIAAIVLLLSPLIPRIGKKRKTLGEEGAENV